MLAVTVYIYLMTVCRIESKKIVEFCSKQATEHCEAIEKKPEFKHTGLDTDRKSKGETVEEVLSLAFHV